MKKIIIILFFLVASVNGQFKGDENKPVDIRGGILSADPVSSLFGFINPANLNMGHSFEMSYSAFGNDGMALGVYTNRLSYEFSEEFNLELNTSFVNSPYNTLGENFTRSLNGIYIDRARINYNPSKDFNISLQFSNSPYRYYNRYNYRGFSSFPRFWYDE